MANVDQNALQFIPSQNQLMVGKKGPLVAKLYLDFTQAQEYDLDMQHAQSVNQFDLCQSIYIDNADGGAAVTVIFDPSGVAFRVVAKSGTEGWYNVVCPNPIKARFLCAGGSPVTILMTNVAIPGAIWSAI